MGLLGLSVKDAVNDISQKLLNPFKPKLTPEEIRYAVARNDFGSGFLINEFINGSFAKPNKPRRDDIRLIGDMMPHVPFTFGGQQKIIKDFYPGNSEPTVQILGPRETDVTIRGRLKSKKLKPPPTRKSGVNLGLLTIGGGKDQEGTDRREELRTFAQEMQQLMDAMRIRGNLVRITMGEFQRFGFIEETVFDMATIADITYEIRFSIIGFNPPSDCKVIGQAKTIPFVINKNLIADVAAFQATASQIPDSFPRSIAEQLNDAIGQIASTVALVTGFVDTVLNEVDDIKSSIARAQGLIKHTRNQFTSFQRRIGGIASFSGVSIASGGGISAGYTNASFLKSTMSFSFGLVALLAALGAQLALIAATEPLARHRIQEGDTLQKLAVKFYEDADQWKEIYDHNKLQTTELVVGDILEIPRV